jgi:hypothetical protein
METTMPQKRERLAFDPLRADSGVLAPHLSTEDTYFATDEGEDTFALIIERILADLPERQRACVEMCAMKGMEYAEVGRLLKCADQTARRETLRGLDKIRKALAETPWARGFTYRIPTDEQPEGVVATADFGTVLAGLLNREEDLDDLSEEA